MVVRSACCATSTPAEIGNGALSGRRCSRMFSGTAEQTHNPEFADCGEGFLAKMSMADSVHGSGKPLQDESFTG